MPENTTGLPASATAEVLTDSRVRDAMQLALRDGAIRRGIDVLTKRGLNVRDAAEIVGVMFAMSSENVLTIHYRKQRRDHISGASGEGARNGCTNGPCRGMSGGK